MNLDTQQDATVSQLWGPSGELSVGFSDEVLDRLIPKAVSLCRSIAEHEFFELPLYIVPQSRIVPILGRAIESGAYTSPRLDLYLQDYLTNSWLGRGPAMVINDFALVADYHPDDYEYMFLGHAIHELAHVVDRFLPREVYATRRSDKIAFERLILAQDLNMPDPCEQTPYVGHEWSFIRTVLHLRYRAKTLGVEISPNVLCAGYKYGLSPGTHYAKALGDEPEHLADQWFSFISARSPPQAFMDLWTSDVDFYRSFLFHPKKVLPMTVRTFFDKLAGKQQERRQQNLEGYRGLVAGIATGEEPSADEIDGILNALGKSLDDFKSDVELCAQRMGNRAMVAMQAELETEMRQIQSKIDEANRELEKAEEHNSDVVIPLDYRLRELRGMQSDTERAMQSLLETCGDSALKNEKREIEASLRRVGNEISEERERAISCENRSEYHKHQATKFVMLDDAKRDLDLVKDTKKAAETARRKVADLQKQQADLTAQLDDVERRMRAW